MKRIFGGIVACLMVSASVLPAAAQYPERPITIINPNAPGGSTDIGIRTYQPFIEACLGNNASIVPVAMPGASSLIGLTALSRAAPDGYTVGSANMPNLVLGVVLGTVPYKYTDFEYLGAVIGSNTGIAVAKDSKLKTFDDFLAMAKSTEGPINIGVAGTGADDHLAGLQVQKLVGRKFNFVPFGSGADTRNALIGGHVDIVLISTTTVGQFTDQVRFLAIAAENRSKYFPDVPTLREKGFDVVGGSTHLLIAPKGTPADVVTKWRDCIAGMLKNPAFLAEAEKRSIALNPMDAKQAADYADAQYKMLKKLWDEEPWTK